MNWVIVGGESGPSARPMKENWVLSIKEQTDKQKSTFFFKQWGTWGSDGIKRNKCINDKLLQKEAYYVMTLDNSEIVNIEELENKKIGIYNSLNSEHALEELNTKINIEYKEYKDIVELFEDLQEGKTDAVLINDSTRNLLETDLSYMKLSLKEIDKVFISIEKEEAENY